MMVDFTCQIFIILVFFLAAVNGQANIKINRDFGFPEAKGFKVYWNVPTFLCHRHGINFKPHTKKFGIISNPKDAFRGKEINILYDPGLFPAFMKKPNGTSAERNGGIPQLGNITLHLEAFRKVLDEVVTKNLSGIGIIDFETWRPVFRQNWNDQVVYKNLSKDLVRQFHPQWTEKSINYNAKVHFERAARIFMKETLELAKLLRPKASWGYYGFPYCYNYRINNSPHCPEIATKENDEISWLFNSSTALYPSIYMSSKLNRADQMKFVIGRLNEAWRIAIKVSKKNFPRVYPYIWFKYYDSQDFLTKEDIYTSFEITRKYKMGGAIIWGASNNVNSKEKCQKLLDYLNSTLGPALLESIKNENSVVPHESTFSFWKLPFFFKPSGKSENSDANLNESTEAIQKSVKDEKWKSAMPSFKSISWFPLLKLFL